MIVHETDKLKIHQLLLNEIKTNCFIVQRDNDALLIDPTHNADEIINYLKEHKLDLKYMVATHGHFDHVSAAADIIEKGFADVLYLDENDFTEVKKTGPIYSMMVFKRGMRVPNVSMFTPEVLSFLDTINLKVKHIGGHTKGSCLIFDKNKNFMFTGDLVLNHRLKITLFNSRENYQELTTFITDVRKDFSPETIIFPGHGDKTTLAAESAHNKKWEYVLKKEINP